MFNRRPSVLVPVMSPQHLAKRQTKIVGTLGPASIPKIRDLIIAGINVFRLNFSHITDPTLQSPIIQEIRRQSADLGIAVAILGDLCGPKIRCNAFKDKPSINLTTGETVILRYSEDVGDTGIITTKIQQIVRDLQIGHRVLLDDGFIQLKVEKRISVTELECRIVVGGVLKPRKGINVPDLKVDIPALTEKDKLDARYMFSQRLDYVALSFVQKSQDVQDLIDWFHQCEAEERAAGNNSLIQATETNEIEDNWRPHIISKIEKPQALEAIDEILRVTDGIMVARGDLGVEVSLERVPVIQKTLIRKANALGKPVITATQMLESMISSPTPTRAEVSDVANAVFDGTDAVMLSAECATGQFPVETVTMMGSICQNAESGHFYMIPAATEAEKVQKKLQTKGVSEFAHPIADAAVEAAIEAEAKAMIVFTTRADMAIFVSKRRPDLSIVAVTPTASIHRRLAMLFGVYPVLSSAMRFHHSGKVSEYLNTSVHPSDAHSEPNPAALAHVSHGSRKTMIHNTDSIYAKSERDILATVASSVGLSIGDTVVFVAGFHAPWPGLSNTIKISRFGDSIRAEKSRGLWNQAFEWAQHHGPESHTADSSRAN
ncbi:pyruvate kinase [Polychytrium aggregatum]|uniref:pyruvate kinase n=1 Tax=Polychytrium aggregatum TaxID=110093 RepID=UPI0022FEF5D5|nr:pyruvate kinase [Polychytrium aggregatum]KAI9204635.1 pyruvate kinase [Polychytrium aggregatum]